MSKIRFINAVIQKNALTQVNVCVPPWEYAVLEGIHGLDIQAVGERIVEREVPDPRDEFARLAVRYGPKNADTPTVAAVYGNFGPGVKALAQEMSRAKRGESLVINDEFDDGLPAALTDAEVDAIMNQGDKDQEAQLAVLGEEILATAAAEVVTAPNAEDGTKVAPEVVAAPIVEPNQSSEGAGEGLANAGDAAGLV